VDWVTDISAITLFVEDVGEAKRST